MMNIILKDIETIEKKINTKFLNKKKNINIWCIWNNWNLLFIFFL